LFIIRIWPLSVIKGLLARKRNEPKRKKIRTHVAIILIFAIVALVDVVVTAVRYTFYLPEFTSNKPPSYEDIL